MTIAVGEAPQIKRATACVGRRSDDRRIPIVVGGLAETELHDRKTKVRVRPLSPLGTNHSSHLVRS